MRQGSRENGWPAGDRPNVVRLDTGHAHGSPGQSGRVASSGAETVQKRGKEFDVAIDYDLLKRLSETPGVPSREEQIRAVVLEAMRPLVDEVRVDAMGNALGRRRGRGSGSSGPRRVMIAAHMDEIGFLVRHVDKNGFLRLQPVGGFDPKTLVAQRVQVHTTGGSVLRGVLMPSGGKPPHLMQPGEQPKAPHVDDFFVDVGLEVTRVHDSAELAKRAGSESDQSGTVPAAPTGQVVSAFVRGRKPA